MRMIEIHASKVYQVVIERGLLAQAGELIRTLTWAGTAVIVSGENVAPLYGDALCDSLRGAGFRVLRWIHPSGEEHKDLESFGKLLNFLSENRVTREDVLLSLGGGVTGDLTGFAAATYQRGMDYVQIPTSLLAMVDSSVGGKTAVNLPTGKNMAGCFWQPSLVICDPDLLETLPKKEYRCGCAEVIKCAMLKSADFFHELDAVPLQDQLEHAIETCVSIKRDLVERDEFDRGSRRMLNFGHSIGHAVEACSGYSVSHGEAVAVGMAVITRAAAARGICAHSTAESLAALLRKYGLPTETELSAEILAESMLADKKRDGGMLPLIVPEEIGRCRIRPVPVDELRAWLRQGGAV